MLTLRLFYTVDIQKNLVYNKFANKLENAKRRQALRVHIISRDGYLIRKIELELSGDADISDDIKNCDTLIYDADSGMALPDFHGKIIKLSRLGKEGSEPIPLPRGRLASLIKTEVTARLTISSADKSVIFKNSKIKLTSHEYSLLSLLVSRADYVPRDEISEKVWGGATDGLINIYIHYLREKLEADGEKVILSSRKYGYKINEKYLEGGIC